VWNVLLFVVYGAVDERRFKGRQERFGVEI
jgi:hypothetical protein